MNILLEILEIQFALHSVNTFSLNNRTLELLLVSSPWLKKKLRLFNFYNLYLC